MCSFIRESIRNFLLYLYSVTTNKNVSFLFLGIVSSFLKYKKCFKLGARNFHFPKYKTFLWSEFFLSFFELGKFLKYSCNIKKFFFVKYKEFLKGFRFPNYNKSFLSRKCKKFLSIRAGKFHFFTCKKI